MSDNRQRRLNSDIRRFNKSLANDSFLGLKRFKVAQKARYEGYDGYTRIYLIELIDTKTNESKEIHVNDYDYQRKIFWGMNDFIIEIRKKENW